MYPSPPLDAHLLTGLEGEASIWQPSAEIVVSQSAGIFSLPIARGFVDFLEPVLVPGAHVRIFNDLERLTHYTREARELLTAFALEHLSAIDDLAFLFGSKFIALGVSAFMHAVGDDRVRTYSDRTSFMRALEAAVLTARD